MTTGGEDAEEPTSGPFDIYETADGPRHVGNPARRRILAEMRGRELTVPAMLKTTGLTKSTISTHLAILHRQRLIAYREDPADRRKKLYYLTARHVGTARRCAERSEVFDPEREGLAPDGAVRDGVVARLLLRSFLNELSCCGLDLAPVARETGRRVGEMVARDRPVPGVHEWAEQVSAFWTQAGLGRVRVENGGDTNPQVIVEDCRICCAGTERKAGLCAVTAGLLEGLASESLRTMVEVRELGHVADPAAANAGCRFEVRVPTPN